jgi:hypothetical protein
MGSEPPSAATAVGTLFNVLERLVLFTLSLAAGLLNLMIGLAVAAHLGVIPKAAADRVLRVTNQATTALTNIMGTPRPAARKHKAKP